VPVEESRRPRRLSFVIDRSPMARRSAGGEANQEASPAGDRAAAALHIQGPLEQAQRLDPTRWPSVHRLAQPANERYDKLLARKAEQLRIKDI